MKALTFIAIAAMSMWISGTAIAQQPNQTESNPSLPQVEGNEAAGQRGQGKGRRGGRRGMQQGQQGQGQGKGQGRRGKGQQGQGQGQGRRGGAQMMEFLFKRFDKNQDGKISQSEAPDRMKERFGNLDTNSDKSVSKEELQAAFEKMSGQGGGRGKGKGKGEGQNGAGNGKGKGEGQNGAGNGKGKNGAGKGQGKNGAGKGEGKNGAGKGQRQGQRQGQRGGMMDPEKMLQFMDKNKDGVIALDEASEKMKGRFDRLDADGSGTITSEELTSAFEKMQKAGKGGKDGKQIGRNKSANPEATKPVKPKRPPMAGDGA